MARTFTHRLATRDKTPLLVGLVGPSGSGKTYSALRLATGFQRVMPGQIFVIDTEAGRAKQYAEKFKFNHVPFGAPFSPIDYLDVISYCVEQGATTIVIDSMSHEHEGPGGVLEWHAKEMDGNYAKQMLAWAAPKAARRRLINTILQYNVNFIFCFRAKAKLKIEKGKDPVDLGFRPIGADEWMYEMTLNCLLLPRTNGVPTWQPSIAGEKEVIKLPEQFASLFEAKNVQLSEDVGETLAKWAAGGKPAEVLPAPALIAEYAACSEPSEFRRLEEVLKASWPTTSKNDRPSVTAAREQCAKRIKDAAKAPEPVASDAEPPPVEGLDDTTKAAS